MGAIVLSREARNYRALAKEYYNLSDEQLAGLDIHHNPPRCEGGRNIPEHLYLYHPSLHKAIHERQALHWASKSSGNKTNKRGRPPTKTEATDRDKECLRRRNLGESRKEIAEALGLSEAQVKRAVREAVRFGWKYEGKSGSKKGTPQRGGVPKGTKQPNQYTVS